MADEKEPPFSRPFQALKSLKKQLPQARRPAGRPAAPGGEKAAAGAKDAEAAPQDPSESPEVAPEKDFEAAMDHLGVEELGKGPELAPKPPPPARPSPAAPPRAKRRIHRGVRGPSDGFDDATPRIDLHGFSVADALAELRRHLAVWRSTGVVRARLVTGRGAHSGDGRAAVRDAVEELLVSLSGVVGVYRASPNAGGEGVVLLELEGPGKKRPGKPGARS